ncbi:MAG: hypothetical protein V1898_03860 [Patescibacteria group bacterium]
MKIINKFYAKCLLIVLVIFTSVKRALAGQVQKDVYPANRDIIGLGTPDPFDLVIVIINYVIYIPLLIISLISFSILIYRKLRHQHLPSNFILISLGSSSLITCALVFLTVREINDHNHYWNNNIIVFSQTDPLFLIYLILSITAYIFVLFFLIKLVVVSIKYLIAIIKNKKNDKQKNNLR